MTRLLHQAGVWQPQGFAGIVPKMLEFANRIARWPGPVKESIRTSPSAASTAGPRQTRAKTIEIEVQDDICSLAFLPSGKHIVGCDIEGKIRCWQTDDAREVAAPDRGGGERVLAIAVSSDGKWVVSGSKAGFVTVWNADTRMKAVEWKGHINVICAVDVSPDATRIATGSDDMTACVWSISTGARFVGPLEHGNCLVGVKYSPDGRYIATATWNTQSIRVYDSRSGHVHADIQMEAFSSESQSLAWSRDGEQLFVASRAGDIKCLDVSTAATVFQWRLHADISPRCIAIACNGTFIAASANSSVSFWDATTHKQIGPLIKHSHLVQSIAISRNYDLAISADKGITVCSLFDLLPLHYVDEKDPQPVKVWQLTKEMASRDKIIESFRAVVCAHEQTHHCEALYADGRLSDAVRIFLGIRDTSSEEAKADRKLMNWVVNFTQRYLGMLERFGDAMSHAGNHDEAVSVYSTALCLGPPISKTLLSKWARTILRHTSPREALDAAAKLEVSRFMAYQAICGTLEEMNCLKQAVECFLLLMDEPKGYSSTQEERWMSAFRERCSEKLVESADAAMKFQNYGVAIERYSSALILKPTRLLEIVIKRSEARALMELWEDALDDANKAVKLDPSCYRGYERMHVALYGAKRYTEAADAFKTMLRKIEQSPDVNIQKLRSGFEDATPIVRDIIEKSIRDMPRVLINTVTGRLYNKAKQPEAFEALPVYYELVSSMTTKSLVDRARIRKEVKKYYRYVMLSHRWDENEPLMQMVQRISVYDLEASRANTKLKSFCLLAFTLGFQWAWSDTCCIDKEVTAVLQEALIAMFRWYRCASLTIVYLYSVLSRLQKVGDLQGSIWNTRAWTYQEYIASPVVRFYTEDWTPYLGLTLPNHKDSPVIRSEMEQTMHVSADEAAVLRPGLDRVREKLFLASMRRTTLPEDTAYSLLGIFNASIPVMYGEGNHAVGRLLEHILTGSGDVSILSWTGTSGSYNSCLPADLTVYNQLKPPHIPPPLQEAEVMRTVKLLRSSLPDLSLAVEFYNRLKKLPKPSVAYRRLKLPAITFPLTRWIPGSKASRKSNLNTYRGTSLGLGTVEIKTIDTFSEAQGLVLVHPWIHAFLDHEFSHTGISLDDTTQALRFLSRLTRPFGALLLAQVSCMEYKRVATDSLIVVRVRKDVPLADWMNVGMIDVQ